MNVDCVFCKILAHESDAKMIFENQLVACFLDIDPINIGHVLIIPKLHCANLDDLPEEMALELVRVSRQILKALRQVYDFPGYTVMQNGGAFCDFGHLHVHVFPRYHGDLFGWTFGEGNKQGYSDTVAEKIKKALETQ